MSRRYYAEDFLSELGQGPISCLISEYVRLRKAGRRYVGLCPFHQEKTPSFSVDPDKQLFYCFGCGQGGNIFTFLMKVENLSFQDAVETLARKVGLPLPKATLDPEAEKRRAQAAGIRKALELARDRYREMLFPHTVYKPSSTWKARDCPATPSTCSSWGTSREMGFHRPGSRQGGDSAQAP